MNLNPNLKSSIACENKTNLVGFQVLNMFFLDCPTMIALEFCVLEDMVVLNLVYLC